MPANTIASDEVVSKVLRDYQDAEIRTSEIARRYGISPATITLWARKAGLQMRTRGRKLQDTPTERQRAIIRTATTVSINEAVRQFGVHKQHVSRLVRRWRGWSTNDKPPFERGDIVLRLGERVTVLRAFPEYGVVLKHDKSVSRNWAWSKKGVMSKKVGENALFSASATTAAA